MAEDHTGGWETPPRGQGHDTEHRTGPDGEKRGPKGKMTSSHRDGVIGTAEGWHRERGPGATAPGPGTDIEIQRGPEGQQ